LQKRLRAEVDPLHERMDTQYKNLSSQIAQQGEQIAKVEKNIIEQFSPITNMVLDHDEKIEKLEKAVH
jgi:chaperonin cofactor prefoldin